MPKATKSSSSSNKLPRKPTKRKINAKQALLDRSLSLHSDPNAHKKLSVSEFGHKYLQLLAREQYLIENARPSFDQNCNDRERVLVDTLRHMDDDHVHHHDEENHEQHQQHQHDDDDHIITLTAVTTNNNINNNINNRDIGGGRGGGEQEQEQELSYMRDICGISELLIPKPYELVEAAMEQEIKRTEEFDADFDSVPSDIKNMIDFSKIPTLKHVEELHFAPLECLTEEGKQKTLTMLPRKELNYITAHMRDNSNPKLAQHKNSKPVDRTEIVLKVALFHPERNLKTQEFHVLGSQPLTDLRDCMYCLNDHIINGKQTRSGYFFIEGTFYNDMRHANNVDYSKQVIDWQRENERYMEQDLGDRELFKTRKMEETRFCDLSIRLHEKYLYCHQGDCKHFIIFTEMRLINDIDNQNYYAYPIRVFQSRIRRKKCLICDIYSAKWVTYSDKHTADEPSFYCDACYRQFHYDEKGELLYKDYEVYRYYHE